MRPDPHPRRAARLPLLAALLAFTAAFLGAAAPPSARNGAIETALDRYVAQPDPAYRWTLAAETADEAGTAFVLDLVSQRWLTPAEVDRPEWRHWLVIVRPPTVRHATALLFLGGGSNRPGPPPRPARELAEIARATGSVVVELRQVPNQPLVFHGDGRERTEDDLIGYTWDQYLRTGDERWPARLPMTKAAVRAMDAATAFLASPAGGGVKVDSYVLAGGSKRGWTAWTTAAVDRRVVGVAPVVIDVLNVEDSLRHHFRAYGFYAPAVGDYVRHRIVDWAGTPELRALYAIEDPFSYRDRLTMPKLILNAAGDQFFTPDSSRFYFAALAGPKHLRYVQNADHGLKGSDAYQTLGAWHHALLQGRPLPRVTWRRTADGTLAVETRPAAREARVWRAHNPAARHFRLATLGPAWTSSPLPAGAEEHRVELPAPAAGWAAAFAEFTFDVGAPAPLKLTTEVFITPDTLPAAAPAETRPRGFLGHGTAP